MAQTNIESFLVCVCGGGGTEYKRITSNFSERGRGGRKNEEKALKQNGCWRAKEKMRLNQRPWRPKLLISKAILSGQLQW